MTFTTESMVWQSGRHFIVTGATSGLELETALAGAGGELLLTGGAG